MGLGWVGMGCRFLLLLDGEVLWLRRKRNSRCAFCKTVGRRYDELRVSGVLGRKYNTVMDDTRSCTVLVMNVLQCASKVVQ